MCSIYTCQKLSYLLSSFLLSALSIKVTLQSSIPLCPGSLKCWWQCTWLTFGGLTDLDNLRNAHIVIESIVKISYITSCVLFRTGAAVKFINSIICVAIYNFLLNIILIPISIFKFSCLLNVLTNLATFTITLNTFRFFGVFGSP